MLQHPPCLKQAVHAVAVQGFAPQLRHQLIFTKTASETGSHINPRCFHIIPTDPLTRSDSTPKGRQKRSTQGSNRSCPHAMPRFSPMASNSPLTVWTWAGSSAWLNTGITGMDGYLTRIGYR